MSPAMTPLSVVPMLRTMLPMMLLTVSAIATAFFLSKSQGGHSLTDVLRNALAALVGAALLVTVAGIVAAARPRTRFRVSIIDFLSCSSKSSSSSEVLKSTT